MCSGPSREILQQRAQPANIAGTDHGAGHPVLPLADSVNSMSQIFSIGLANDNAGFGKAELPGATTTISVESFILLQAK